VQVHRARGRIRERGAELVFVGNGSRQQARAFREEFAIAAPLYVDPERRAYAALGMKRGSGPVAVLAAARNSLRALRAGFRQTGVQGDAWQLGGVLVVRRGGVVAYRYLSGAAGDHPPVDEVLAAI
jgi:hypothetical protein